MQIIINLSDARARTEWLVAYAAESIAAANPPETRNPSLFRLIINPDDSDLIKILESNAISSLSSLLSPRKVSTSRLGVDRLRLSFPQPSKSIHKDPTITSDAILNFLAADIALHWFLIRHNPPTTSTLLSLLQSDLAQRQSSLQSLFPPVPHTCRRPPSPF